MFKFRLGKNKQQPIEKKKKESSGAVREFIAKLSRGLMLPIAMLPIAGLFLGIGNAINTNAGDSQFLKILGLIIKEPGDVIFGNLAVLFAIAIAITFTGDVGVAGLSSFVGWIVFCALQNALILPVTDVSGAIESYRFLYWNLNPTMFGAVFTNNVGIQSLCTSVFGGLTVGFSVAFLYNKFKNIELPTILGFFSGVRFIPIITFLAMLPLSLLFCLIWPAFGMGLFYAGIGLGYMGSKTFGFNAFIFGFIERSLVPFGLHHAFYTPLWYTPVGGQINWLTDGGFVINNGHFKGTYESLTWIVNGSAAGTFTNWADFIAKVTGKSAVDFPISGDQSCWMFLSELAGTKVQLGADPNAAVTTLTFEMLCKSNLCNGSVNAGQYMQGKYPFMMFGLPAAAAAMIFVVPKENRKVATSIIGSAAVTCFLTGITEPLEFTFLFLAPWMYWGFHALFCGLSFWAMSAFGAHMGMTFSGGAIDFVVYGVLPDVWGAHANCWLVVIIGAVLIPIYFFGFTFFIKKFDIKTPGREGAEVKLMSKKEYFASKNGQGSEESPMRVLSAQLIKAYGGLENIKNVDACITKLRIQVADQSKADKQKILDLGARGVMYPSKQSVYAVFGTQADRIKNEMKSIMADPNAAAIVEKASASDQPVKEEASNKSAKAAKPVIICAPANGKIISTKEVKDETFSQDIMGKGFAIIPSSGKFVAPIKGKVALIDNHAYAIEGESGVQVLVHIGIDTVTLAGKGVFKHHVKVGDKVNVGDPIIDADLNKIKKAKLSTATPVIALNETIGEREVKISKTGQAKAKDKVLTIK